MPIYKNLYVTGSLRRPAGFTASASSQTLFGLTEETGKQRYQGDTDEGNAAASHKLLHTLRLCTRVIVTVTFQKVDRTPDTKTCTECYYESLQNSDCAVEKCHNKILLAALG